MINRDGIVLSNAWVETPVGGPPGDISIEESAIRIISYDPLSGQLLVELLEDRGAAWRGHVLRRYEMAVKVKYGKGISVWLRPAKDRNPLRRLRGIEVK